MSVAETLLVYVGIPLLIVLFFAALTLRPGRTRPRWKSGQAWEHEPVWFEPHPEATGGHGEEHGDAHAALGGATAAGALTSGQASPVPASAGPLGGARGTW